MQIKIENYQEFNPAEKYTCMFDLYLPGTNSPFKTFRNIKLMKAKSGREFYSWPSYVSGENEDGSKKYSELFPLSDFDKKEIECRIDKELEVFLNRPVNRFSSKQYR